MLTIKKTTFIYSELDILMSNNNFIVKGVFKANYYSVFMEVASTVWKNAAMK